MTALAIVAAVATVLALVYVKTYHRLVDDRDAADDAWAGLDAELRRRRELVPDLVAAVEAGGVQERRLLDELVRAERRAAEAGDEPAARTEPEHDLAAAIASVVALSEQYPLLATQPQFVGVRQELAASEQRLGEAVWRHDVRVGDLNRRLRGFPAAAIAGRHHIAGGVPFGG